MLDFLKKLFAIKPVTVTPAPYKVETPVQPVVETPVAAAPVAVAETVTMVDGHGDAHEVTPAKPAKKARAPKAPKAETAPKKPRAPKKPKAAPAE